MNFYELRSFFEGMYFFYVATFSEGMLSSGVVKHFRKFIDWNFKSTFEI